MEMSLPAEVTRALSELVETARVVLGSDLRSVVLYGSAAEGQLRPTSDVNVIFVVSEFDAGKMDRLREPLRVAHAAIRLSAMVLLEGEVQAAVEAFAVKFADILHRRQVLFGADPFTGVTVPRGAEIARLKQVLLNLVLRLRQTYLLRSLREEQTVAAIADASGPLRACAAALRELQGKPVLSPKEALSAVAKELAGSWDEALGHLSEARENRPLPPHAAGPTLLSIMDLARRMHGTAQTLA
jgi:predicted nucleotidyltransferase